MPSQPSDSHLSSWRRQMSHVLYEEDHLPKPDQLTAPDLPLPLAGTVADHQGLHLTTDGDNLVGRAENGKLCSLTSLSTTLVASVGTDTRAFDTMPVLLLSCCHNMLVIDINASGTILSQLI